MIMFISTLLGLADTKIPSGFIHPVIYSLTNLHARINLKIKLCVGKGKKRNSQHPYNLLKSQHIRCLKRDISSVTSSLFLFLELTKINVGKHITFFSFLIFSFVFV